MDKMGSLGCTKWGKNRVYDVQNGEFMRYKMGKNIVHFATNFLFDKISKKVYIYGSDEQLQNKKKEV